MLCKKSCILAVLIIFLLSACNQESPSVTKLDTTEDKVSYSIGLNIAKNFKKDGLDNLNTNIIASAMNDILKENETLLTFEEANEIMESYFKDLEEKISEKNQQESEDFLRENKGKEGVVTLDNGLQYKILKEGDGATPTIDDKVKVHYKGTLIDETVFDSSEERGEPVDLPVGGVIPGWTQALQLMPVGSKWQLFIPSDLAYGEQGAGAVIGPNSTLIFEVELLSIEGNEDEAEQ